MNTSRQGAIVALKTGDNTRDSSAELPDEAVVRRVLDGDTGLFELLIRRHNQGLYRLARSIVVDDHEARDVVQEAYISAFTRLESFKGPAGFASWLYVITRNQALGVLRRKRELPTESDSIEQLMQEKSDLSGQDPGGTLERERLGLLLEAAIEKLPDVFRTVFVLRVVQGLSVRETSEVLGLNEETVKTRVFRARRLLRKEFASYMQQAGDRVYEFAGSRCDDLTAGVMARIARIAAERNGQSPT